MKKLIFVFLLIFLLLNSSVFSQTEKKVTRIEFIAYIMSNLGEISSDKNFGFDDLDPNDRYYQYAAAAKKYEIVTGYEDNTLHPYDTITRQDAVVILSRAYNIKTIASINIKNFSDYEQISPYAQKYISAAVSNGILEYRQNISFYPKSTLTVDEMISLEERFKQHINNNVNFLLGYPKPAEEKEYKAITVSIKMSKPCTVYYKLYPVSNYLGGFKPQPDEITSFLTAVSIADMTINVNIYPEDFGMYNIYIVGVDLDGNYTDVKFIPNVTAHRFSSGKGSEKDPYLIYTKEQLEGIKNYPNACFRLENDITLTDKWNPIEIDSGGYIGFAGVLDGNYHKITGLNIRKYSKNAGLFSEIYGGTIKKLYIDANVAGNDNVGIIAGVLEGGNINECFVTGRVNATGNNAGAIVGINNGSIKNCISAAYLIEASAYAGGLAGNNRGDIINCLSAAYSVSADMYASSISGINIGGKISNNVCANMYADDVITTKSGRVTTNKQNGRTSKNYCYDKMMADTSVALDTDSSDGLEISWDKLTSVAFYKDVMEWDTNTVWNNSISEDFRLLSLRGFKSIDMEKGLTMYAPIKIYTEKELLKVCENTNYHYILMNDISISDTSPWKMIGSSVDENSGFNGTFDGNNHSISGINISGSNEYGVYGMFGTISSGTVRNLNLVNIAAEGHSLVGGIAGINYGYIENCSVKGKIYALLTDNMLSVGGIVGNNYGFIENVSSGVKIRAKGQVLTVGGIAANNEGFINKADFSGKIEAEQNTLNSNAVAGGIVGINTSGMIYNSYANINITSKACISYIGATAGIVNGGEIYKASSIGQIYVNPSKNSDSSVYVGGIAGLTPEGLIMNSLSKTDIYIKANKVYAGGIAGYNQYASLQNTYAMNNIEADGGYFDNSSTYAAGICGFSESGFIADNVSLNKSIQTNGYADAICIMDSDQVMCNNNYFSKNIVIDGEIPDISSAATEITPEQLDMSDFFFKPISDGGLLGWIQEDVWYIDKGYNYPLLSGVKKQDTLKG